MEDGAVEAAKINHSGVDNGNDWNQITIKKKSKKEYRKGLLEKANELFLE